MDENAKLAKIEFKKNEKKLIPILMVVNLSKISIFETNNIQLLLKLGEYQKDNYENNINNAVNTLSKWNGLYNIQNYKKYVSNYEEYLKKACSCVRGRRT